MRLKLTWASFATARVDSKETPSRLSTVRAAARICCRVEMAAARFRASCFSPSGQQRDDTSRDKRERPDQVHIEPGPPEKAQAILVVDDQGNRTHDSEHHRGVKARGQKSWGERAHQQLSVMRTSTGNRQLKQKRREHEPCAMRRRHQERS